MPSLAQYRVVDPVLTNVALGYVDADLVGGRLFPDVPVDTIGGQVIQFGTEDFVIESSERAPTADVRAVQYGYQGVPFALELHDLDGVVPIEAGKEVMVPGIALAARTVRGTMKKLRLELEKQQADMARNASLYPSTNKVNVSSTPWTDKVNGNPGNDVDTAMSAVRGQIGQTPNTLLLSAKAFIAARNHPLVIQRFQYTTADSITAEMLAGLWDVESVVVGKSVYSASGVMTDIWGGDVIAAYVPKEAMDLEKESPSFGFTYVLRGHPSVAEPYYLSTKRSWMYPISFHRMPVIPMVRAGYLIQNAA